MDAQKWDDVPILSKILPGPACEGAVGMMDHSVHPKTVVPSATPRVFTVRDFSLSLPHYHYPPSTAGATSIITSAGHHSSLDGTHDLGDIDWLPEAVAFSDLHGLL